MARVLSRLSIFVLLIAALVAAGAYWADRQLSAALELGGEARVYELRPGTGFSAMTAQLHREGVLDHPWLLDLYARLTGEAARIQAGEYSIEPGTNGYELMALLVSGKVKRYRVTLVEGWTFRQIVEALRAHPELERKLEPGVSLWDQLEIDDPLHAHPEGQFFPDTYSFVRGASDRSILRRAHRRLRLVLEQEWRDRADNLPLATPYEALIMASIVEKETGLASERQRIAGVFAERLQRNMRLQTDPTVIYGLGETYDNNLRSKHLRDESNAYNTYRHRGLPPTPIAAVGRAAIHAALHPAADGALYFVARGDGSHYFSKTLEEHHAAVRRYQLKRREDYRSAPKPQ